MNFLNYPQHIMFVRDDQVFTCTHTPHLPKEASDITTKYMQEQHGQFPIVTLKCLWLENMLLICPYPRGWTSIGGKPVEISLQKSRFILLEKLNQIPIILTFGQFDHLVILDKSI
jgi:hypothetical protein